MCSIQKSLTCFDLNGIIAYSKLVANKKVSDICVHHHWEILRKGHRVKSFVSGMHKEEKPVTNTEYAMQNYCISVLFRIVCPYGSVVVL